MKNGVSDRCEFICRDVLSEAVPGEFFAVLSNPPYVSEEEYEGLAPEIYFEPKIAFVGGKDGLTFYEKIVEDYGNLLNEGGFFAFEIGYDEGCALREIGEKHGFSTEIIPDLSGNDRVAVLRRRTGFKA